MQWWLVQLGEVLSHPDGGLACPTLVGIDFWRNSVISRSTLSRSIAVAFGTSLIALAPLAMAQQSLEKVTVTGSNIKRTDAETASPVQVITREDIERTGKQSVQEVLRGITADGQGSIPSSFSSGFAAGSAAVSLRGLGVNSTLVLVNGRRMSTYGLADDGTRNFVDLNSLPLEAVDRIEVVKDGASAIYGADAVGGVVNVILRKNYTGGSAGVSYGQSGHSDGQNTRAFGSLGFGDFDADKYNVFFTVEASNQKNIWSKDRGMLGQSDLSPYGFWDTTNGQNRGYFGLGPTANSPYGVIRDPVTNARVNLISCGGHTSATTGLCLYNPLDEQEIQPQVDRINLFGRGTFELAPSTVGYAEFGYFTTRTKSNGTLGANNDSGVFLPGDPTNPLFTHGAMNLPAGHPDNPFGVDRLLYLRPAELGGRDGKTKNDVIRLVAGVQGAFAGWDYDVGAAYIHSRLNDKHMGYINYDAMQAALDDGTYRITNPSLTSPSVLAAISPVLDRTSTSTVKSIDFKASREVASLAGGGLAVAIGGETRWEDADTPAVPGTETASIVGLGYSAFKSSRRVSALYGEINAPVLPWLELNGAVRLDHYSDFGDSTTPKIGFKIKPIDQLAIRGTYSEAFRAPGPAEIGGSSFGFTSVGILSQGSPGIKPEKAKSYTLGIVADPLPGTSVTLDYWRIDRRDEIVQADPATIIPSGQCVHACDGTDGTPNFSGQKVAGAKPNSFMYYDVDGNLVTVSGYYENANKTLTDGVDLELRHRMNLGDAGRFTFQFNWTKVNKYERELNDGTKYEYAGTHGPIVLSAGGGTPKDRASLSVTWDRGPVSVSGVLNYVGPIKLIDHIGEMAEDNGDGTVTDTTNGIIYNYAGGSLNCAVYDMNGKPWNGDCKLPSFITIDLFGKWSLSKNLDLNFSVQNLFDKKAPLDPYLPLTYGINYNQTWHQAGAVGRFFTVGARYTF